jgi:predicted 3-demethylubiquinone-9 3-methyltransferase (glyoxalase superfamily)
MPEPKTAPKVSQKITTFLWFDNQAEEAAKFYCSIFKDSGIIGTTHYPEGSPYPAGSVMTVVFKLAGQEFIAMNAGPYFKFTEAISLSIDCKDQAEVDHYWEKLTEGGEESQCGWLKDKYGLSWQVTPTVLIELTSGPDREKAKKAMGAMLKMKKIDIAELKRAVGE